MAAKKQAQQLARQLFKLSFENGQISAERVAGALAYLEKTKPAQMLSVLKTYHRLVATELARGQAIVEHAGPVSPSALQNIESVFSKKYGRPIAASAKPAQQLLAGLRIRIGNDIYENSAAGQLAQLAASV